MMRPTAPTARAPALACMRRLRARLAVSGLAVSGLAASGVLSLAACQSKSAPAEQGSVAVAAPPAAGAGAPAAPARIEEEAAVPIAVRAQGQLGIGLGHLYIDLQAPKGAKLTSDAPLSIRASGGIGLRFPEELHGALGAHPLPLRLPIEVADGATGPARVEVAYFWCTDGAEAVCRREHALLNVELDLSGTTAGGEAQLRHRATAEL